jgi:hypothetical protein
LEELTQEMKLLHWHKLANEAALKAALIRTRKHKAQVLFGAVELPAMPVRLFALDPRLPVAHTLVFVLKGP